MDRANRDEKSIFNAARRIELPEARRQYLARACGDDLDLHARVEALLRVHDADSSFLRSTAIGGLGDGLDGTAEEPPGTVIGPYTLLSQLGEGGMGIVFLAEQSQPVRRRVALKIVRPGMGSGAMLARFEAERQALALMDHPNIAKVLDAGTIPAGRSYFVMELVQGVPITRYCDTHRLTLQQRLGLFVQVCRGAQHAHQKGILHRDLKPSNVLVPLYDGKPVPKIIDFGLAKATRRKSPDSTLVTQVGLVVGTPEYMSPEQADPIQYDIDTRSDVYSLGVLLYELLTGTTPLRRERVKDAGLAEVLFRIREEEPPRPSVRLNELSERRTIAANRGVEPAKLTRQVRGDLDWIALKCLEKDRNRRYESADGLARDVERYLRHEPVEASPPGTVYRLRKFGRRHRTALATGVAFVLLLLVGVSVCAWQAVRATAERDRKEIARRQARQALNQLTDEMVERLMARQARVTEQDRAFLRRILALHEEFARAEGDSPEGRAGMADARFRVGVIRHRLGEHKEAEEAYRAAADLQQKLAEEFPARPEYRRNLVRSHNGLGNLLRETGRPQEAEQVFRALVGLVQKLADDFPDQLDYRRGLAAGHNNLGTVLNSEGRPKEAEMAQRMAVDIMRKLVADPSAPPDYRRLLAIFEGNLGYFLFAAGRYREADERIWAGRDLLRKLAAEFPGQPEHFRELAHSHTNLGMMLGEAGQVEKAAVEFHAAIDVLQQLASEFRSQPEYRALLARSYHNLGESLRGTQPRQQVEEAYRAARDLFARLVADCPRVPEHQVRLALTLDRLALMSGPDHAAARQLLEQANTLYRGALAVEPKSPFYRQSYRIHLGTAGATYFRLGDHRKAVGVAEELARLAYEPAADAYRAARRVAQCMALVEKDSQSSAAMRQELGRAYADRAMTLLRTAVRRGYKDVRRMRKDPALKPLHLRDDFQMLLRELDAAPGRP